MSCLDLSATSKWEFDLDIRDSSGPVDMTGLDCFFVLASKAGSEVARATTASGTIVAVTGPTGAGRSRLQITIGTDEHSALDVDHGFVWIEGDLAVQFDDDYEWLGKREFRVFAGPSWTGATGA